MPDTRLDWGAQALQRRLTPLLPGLSVEVAAQCSSTNTALLERARDDKPCLLVAEHQSGGRGRLGRSWQSARGASLTFSLALPLRRSDWSGLSLAVGVALADALEPRPATGAPRVGLKWPNDLWLMDGRARGRKLGGILIETVAWGSSRLAVIGIGLNVLRLDVPSASSGFGCLQELDLEVNAPAVLRRVAPALVDAVLLFEGEGFLAFEQGFAARDVLRHQPVRTTQPDAIEGVAQGVSGSGALLVRTRTGLHSVCSGEVSVRLIPLEGAAQEPSC
jgi:BirA family biotin operon repressor/biotin-[acetyl-CoA-carboxylase] ligase